MPNYAWHHYTQLSILAILIYLVVCAITCAVAVATGNWLENEQDLAFYGSVDPLLEKLSGRKPRFASDSGGYPFHGLRPIDLRPKRPSFMTRFAEPMVSRMVTQPSHLLILPGSDVAEQSLFQSRQAEHDDQRAGGN